MEHFFKGDIVRLKEEITIASRLGKYTYTIRKDLNYEVVMSFTYLEDEQKCLVDVGDFVCPLSCEDLELVQRAENKEDTGVPAFAPDTLKFLVDGIPRYSLGYVFRINETLVAAHSLEEAISVFREHSGTEIESIKLLDKECSYIQNYIPEI